MRAVWSSLRGQAAGRFGLRSLSSPPSASGGHAAAAAHRWFCSSGPEGPRIGDPGTEAASSVRGDKEKQRPGATGSGLASMLHSSHSQSPEFPSFGDGEESPNPNIGVDWVKVEQMMNSEWNKRLSSEDVLNNPQEILEEMGVRLPSADDDGDEAGQETSAENGSVMGMYTGPPRFISPEELDFTNYTDLALPVAEPPLGLNPKVYLCPGKRQGKSGFPGTCRIFNMYDVHFANVSLLKRFLSANSQIKSRKDTGLCAKCQRKVAKCIKRARHLGTIPFVGPFRIDEVVQVAKVRRARRTKLRQFMSEEHGGSKFRSVSWDREKAQQTPSG